MSERGGGREEREGTGKDRHERKRDRQTPRREGGRKRTIEGGWEEGRE